MTPGILLKPLIRWAEFCQSNPKQAGPFNGPGGWDFDFDAGKPYLQLCSKAKARPKVKAIAVARGVRQSNAAHFLRPKARGKQKNRVFLTSNHMSRAICDTSRAVCVSSSSESEEYTEKPKAPGCGVEAA